MSHTQNLAQGLGLNSLSSSLLSNAAILNQPQQHQLSSQQQHHPIPQIANTQQHSHTNGSSSGTNNLIQTTSANNSNHTQSITNQSNGSNGMNGSNGLSPNNSSPSSATAAKKKKKKKPPKEKKPRPKPGEIRLTTALDGSTLYGCPECHMVYPGNLYSFLYYCFVF